MRHQTIIYLAFFFSFATYANSNLILKKTINPFYKKSLIAIENENKRGILLNNFENELYKKISLDKIDTRINKRLVKNPVSNVALWVNWKTKVKERLSSTSKEVLDLYPRLGKRAIYL